MSKSEEVTAAIPDPNVEPSPDHAGIGPGRAGTDRAPCGHPEAASAVQFVSTDYLTGDAFSLIRCSRCGLGWTSPQPDRDACGRYYPDPYHGQPGVARFPWYVERLQAWLYGRRAKEIESVAGGLDARCRAVLDIGCGRGHQLEAFRARGWAVMGTELSDQSARHAREVLGIEVQTGAPSTWRDLAGRFDAVVLWHVLEHLQDPSGILREAHRLLRPGGILLVGVPNLNSFEARITTDRWFHLDLPRHLWHFTPASMQGLIKDSGFLEVRWNWFAPEFDLFSLIQSIENALGLPRNLLYSVLRKPGARLLPGRPGFGWVCLGLLLAVPLGVFGLPFVLVAGWLKSGSSMTVIARTPVAETATPHGHRNIHPEVPLHCPEDSARSRSCH